MGLSNPVGEAPGVNMWSLGIPSWPWSQCPWAVDALSAHSACPRSCGKSIYYGAVTLANTTYRMGRRISWVAGQPALSYFCDTENRSSAKIQVSQQPLWGIAVIQYQAKAQ